MIAVGRQQITYPNNAEQRKLRLKEEQSLTTIHLYNLQLTLQTHQKTETHPHRQTRQRKLPNTRNSKLSNQPKSGVWAMNSQFALAKRILWSFPSLSLSQIRIPQNRTRGRLTRRPPWMLAAFISMVLHIVSSQSQRHTSEPWNISRHVPPEVAPQPLSFRYPEQMWALEFGWMV